MRDYEEFVFPNGIRLVHKQAPHTKIAHCGFVLNIGSRDEKPHQLGIAHFWEHMAFKGTQKRRAFHILNRVDSVGGDLNAYTTKEKICFYASLLDQHFDKAVELLTDITFFSTFPEREIEKERGVILEEMAMYHDDPTDAIQDDFDEVLFPKHPLGHNILGTRESVSSFSRDNFHAFIEENLNTEEVIFSSVSALPFSKVKKVVERYLVDIPARKVARHRQPFDAFQPVQIETHKSITQAHCALGTTSYSISDEKRIPFFMLVNLLGGPGMNSRLNLAIREKYGFVYSIDAHMSSYQDTGQFAIYFATELKTLQRCVRLVEKELKRLREMPLGTVQLHTAKQQLMGQLAMGEESNLGLMLMMGKSLIDIERIDSLEKIFEQIKNISSHELMAIANEVFPPERISTLYFLPENSN